MLSCFVDYSQKGKDELYGNDNDAKDSGGSRRT